MDGILRATGFVLRTSLGTMSLRTSCSLKETLRGCLQSDICIGIFMQKITYVIFHSEHPLQVVGQDSSAENATLELSYALKRQGHRVIVAANLIDSNECIKNGVEFLNFGENYNIASIFEKLENIEDYILM